MLAVCKWLSDASANKVKVQVLVSKLFCRNIKSNIGAMQSYKFEKGEVVIGRAEVSIVTPQPREKGDQCAEHCIHAIVWDKVDDKVRILIDRVLDGVPQDRSRWFINSTMVKDIFVHVGWDGFVDDPEYNCVLDDGGVLFTADVPVEVFNGFYGSLRVSQSLS